MEDFKHYVEPDPAQSKKSSHSVILSVLSVI